MSYQLETARGRKSMIPKYEKVCWEPYQSYI